MLPSGFVGGLLVVILCCYCKLDAFLICAGLCWYCDYVDFVWLDCLVGCGFVNIVGYYNSLL